MGAKVDKNSIILKIIGKYLAGNRKDSIFAASLRKGNDSLAQLVEHNTFNVGVLGSNPKRITEIEREFNAKISKTF
jgi:hypothetical protein